MTGDGGVGEGREWRWRWGEGRGKLVGMGVCGDGGDGREEGRELG